MPCARRTLLRANVQGYITCSLSQHVIASLLDTCINGDLRPSLHRPLAAPQAGALRRQEAAVKGRCGQEQEGHVVLSCTPSVRCTLHEEQRCCVYLRHKSALHAPAVCSSHSAASCRARHGQRGAARRREEVAETAGGDVEGDVD